MALLHEELRDNPNHPLLLEYWPDIVRDAGREHETAAGAEPEMQKPSAQSIGRFPTVRIRILRPRGFTNIMTPKLQILECLRLPIC